ncbi:amidohydrolase family protein [Gordonia aichiensis]|nr:amidohydrolase family protein [Gordonia aichiensis]
MDRIATPINAGSVDVHAHYFGADLADRLTVPADPRWPTLVVDGPAGRIMLGDRLFRNVRSSLWDLEDRVAELDRANVGVQVISPVPVTLAYWASEPAAVAYARALNDSTAAAVHRAHGRLLGLGALPLPHLNASITELYRLVEELGLLGIEIGTQVAGMDLDSPHLDPLFSAAETLGAAIFVHPTDGGGGVIRRSGQPYDFGLGMISDTAIAASALVFGGVIERYPRLRVALAHGCGTFAWAYPRLRLGGSIFNGIEPTDVDRLVSSLWVDSLVFDPQLFRLLTERFGADHIMLGTDYPFVPGQLENHHDFLSDAVTLGALTAPEVEQIRHRNAAQFFASSAETSMVAASSGHRGGLP